MIIGGEEEAWSPEEGEVEQQQHKALWIYEPGAEEILQRLLPDFVEITVYRALLESTASEHGARMTAMRSASENADDMIERPDAGGEPRAPGGDHSRNHGSRRRRGGARIKERRQWLSRTARTSAGSRRSRAS